MSHVQRITRSAAHRRDAEELLAQAQRIRRADAVGGLRPWRDQELARAALLLAEAAVHATLATLPDDDTEDGDQP